MVAKAVWVWKMYRKLVFQRTFAHFLAVEVFGLRAHLCKFLTFIRSAYIILVFITMYLHDVVSSCVILLCEVCHVYVSLRIFMTVCLFVLSWC